MSYTAASSGTYAYDPAISDLMLDAFERCGMRAAELTAEHLQSARRSANLVQSRWSSRGINLWKVSLVSVLMTQAVSSYPVDPSVIGVLDTYLRQYQMGAATNGLSASTTLGSAVVKLSNLAATPLVGAYVAIPIPVSLGGIVIQGIYQITASAGTNAGLITAASAATSGAIGGAVPKFTSVVNTTTILVTLANHGLVAGGPFNVQVATLVGGLTLQGYYTVGTVVDGDNFQITPGGAASSSQVVYENGGVAQSALQGSGDPTDILLYPLSRNDWAALPDKKQQGRPTSYWFDRTLSPTLNVWQVPDANGPYVLNYYVVRQIQDASPTSGQVSDLPYRFLEAYAAGMAAHLAMKWAPDRAIALKEYADECWAEASDEDREKVTMRIQPDFSSFYR